MIGVGVTGVTLLISLLLFKHFAWWNGDANWAAAGTAPVLRSLHENRISIIEWGALPRVFETDGPARRRPPSSAIENIGSDYAEDEEEEEEEDEDAEAADLGELGDEFPC